MPQRPEIILESSQTETLGLTSLEKSMLPRMEMAIKIIGLWAYEHDLMTTTKLFVEAKPGLKGVHLFASEIRTPTMEDQRQSQHFVVVGFHDHRPDVVTGSFVGISYGPERKQKLQVSITMEAASKGRLDFTKTKGEICLTDKHTLSELVYMYYVQDEIGELRLGSPNGSHESKILLARTSPNNTQLQLEASENASLAQQVALLTHNQKTIENLIYGIIYTMDLTQELAPSPEIFTHNAFALIEKIGKIKKFAE